jgi:hypothetical protein
MKPSQDLLRSGNITKMVVNNNDFIWSEKVWHLKKVITTKHSLRRIAVLSIPWRVKEPL